MILNKSFDDVDIMYMKLLCVKSDHLANSTHKFTTGKKYKTEFHINHHNEDGKLPFLFILTATNILPDVTTISLYQLNDYTYYDKDSDSLFTHLSLESYNKILITDRFDL